MLVILFMSHMADLILKIETKIIEMKNRIIPLLIILCFSASCNDDQENVTPEPQLPPITSEGNNTFGCLIDGELFLAKQRTDIMGIKDISFSHYDDSILAIKGKSLETRKHIALQTTFWDGQTSLNLYDSTAHEIGFITQFIDFRSKIGGSRYFVEKSSSAKLNIIKDNNEIFAGTFFFTAIGEDLGDTIHITEGRFDIEKI